MELLYWNPVKRMRSRELPYTSPEFVRGYDLDIADFTELVTKYNSQHLLPSEELRLFDHVRTMINIVFENPKVNPRNPAEKEDCADFMFPDAWGSMKYIKAGTSPYSYIYRSCFTAACRYFKKKISERNKANAIEEHLEECAMEYRAEAGDGRVYNINFD